MSAHGISMVSLALFLALLPLTALADNTPPDLSPIGDRICSNVECGKGTCKPDILRPFGYTCECDNGWTRNDDDSTNDELKFLPCVIPKCSLDYNCQPAPPRVQDKGVPLNQSMFDPCFYIYCGEGKCTRDGDYKHKCQCKQGFDNLLNISFFPCYSSCTIGSDCSKLGIKVANSGSSPSASGQSSNTAPPILPDKLYWISALVMSTAAYLRN